MSIPVLMCAALPVLAGDFINLGFDDGPLPPNVDLWQSAHQLLPGWTLRAGEEVVTEVAYGFGDGRGAVGMFSASSIPLFEGRWGIRLTPGPKEPGGSLDMRLPMSISQTGTVPEGSTSLLFRAALVPGSFGLSLNGQDQPYFPVSSFYASWDTPRTTYGVDVSAFAGKEVVLKLTGFPFPNELGGGAWVDTLEFSSTIVVPEPSSVVLLFIGLAALAWRRNLKSSAEAQ